MGLDAVELLMEVEKEFGITIGDRESESLTTVDLLHQAILTKLAEKQDIQQLSEDEVWNKLVALIREQMGDQNLDVKPESRFHPDLGF